MRRSMLFLPGNTPNILINGGYLGADAVIFDLEDAVSPDEKDSARILVRNAMSYLDLGRCEVIVRINSLDTDFWRCDLDAIVPYRPNWIMLPKTARAADVQQADEYLAQLEEKLESASVILDIEPNGAFAVKAKRPDAVLIFIAPPSLEELERRLRGRGDTSEEQIALRQARVQWEMDQSQRYDYIVINDQVETCANTILNIIAEKAN